MSPSPGPAADSVARSVAAVLLVMACACVYYWDHNQAPYHHIDERAYLDAMAAVARGGSPYAEGAYLYPPTLAVVGAELQGWWGERWVTLGLRYLNLLGGSLAAWLALTWAPWRWWVRAGLAVLLVAFAPPLATGVTRGNLSLLVAGLVLAALSAGMRRPAVAGGLLGLSLVLKPMAMVATLVLLLHRSQATTRQRGWLAVSTAATGLVALAVGWPFLVEMPSRLGGNPQAVRLTSLHRVLYAFGLTVPAVVLFLMVAVGTVLLARRRARSPVEVMALATAGSLLSLPIVWSHTLLLALPLQVRAAALVLERWRTVAGRDVLWFEVAPVTLAVVSIFLSNGFGALEQAPQWALGLWVAIPTLSPVFLCAYILSRGGSGFAADAP